MTSIYVVCQRICMQFQGIVWELQFDSDVGILIIHRGKGTEYLIQVFSQET